MSSTTTGSHDGQEYSYTHESQQYTVPPDCSAHLPSGDEQYSQHRMVWLGPAHRVAGAAHHPVVNQRTSMYAGWLLASGGSSGGTRPSQPLDEQPPPCGWAGH